MKNLISKIEKVKNTTTFNEPEIHCPMNLNQFMFIIPRSSPSYDHLAMSTSPRYVSPSYDLVDMNDLLEEGDKGVDPAVDHLEDQVGPNEEENGAEAGEDMKALGVEQVVEEEEVDKGKEETEKTLSMEERHKRSPACLIRCLKTRRLHPAQCHALC